MRGAPVEPGAPAGRADGGRAAKPGRTAPGRLPDIGGRSPGRIGRAGGRGIPVPLVALPNGLLPARGGRGIGVLVPNGLFPAAAGRVVAGGADESESSVGGFGVTCGVGAVAPALIPS